MSAPPGQCPRCSAALTPGQDWCLNCGYSATTRILRPGNWKIPIIIVTVVFVLALGGVAAAFVAVSDDAEHVRTTTNPQKTLPATGTSSTPAPTTAPTTPTTSTPTASSPTTSTPTASTATPTTSTPTTTANTPSAGATPGPAGETQPTTTTK